MDKINQEMEDIIDSIQLSESIDGGLEKLLKLQEADPKKSDEFCAYVYEKFEKQDIDCNKNLSNLDWVRIVATINVACRSLIDCVKLIDKNMTMQKKSLKTILYELVRSFKWRIFLIALNLTTSIALLVKYFFYNYSAFALAIGLCNVAVVLVIAWLIKADMKIAG